MHLTWACHSSCLTKAIIARVLVGGSNSSKDNNINNHDIFTIVVEKSETWVARRMENYRNKNCI